MKTLQHVSFGKPSRREKITVSQRLEVFSLARIDISFFDMDQSWLHIQETQQGPTPYIQIEQVCFEFSIIFLTITRHHWFINRDNWRSQSTFNTTFCNHFIKWSNFGHFVQFINIHIATKNRLNYAYIYIYTCMYLYIILLYPYLKNRYRI